MSQGRQQRGGRTNNNNNNNNQRNNDNQNQPRNNGPNPNRVRAQTRVTGMVRAVPSGDTVILVNLQEQTTNGPPREIQLTFLGLRAPMLGKKTKEGEQKDAPFAWQSREYLRKLLVGKSVVYRVEHEFGNRSYGEVWLDESNVRYTVVEQGWAEVAPRKERKGGDKEKKDTEVFRKEDQEIQELTELMETAKTAKRGMWNPDVKNAIRKVNYYENVRETNPDDLFSFFEKNKGKTLQGVVEQVRTGTTLRVYIPNNQDEFTVNLSGVLSPIYKFNDESGSQPFSREAKFFTEHCLLNREVTITLETMDKYNNFYGTVLDVQKRNIGHNLLKMGLASFVEWNAPQELVAPWKEAEKSARDTKLRLWKKFKPTESAKPSGPSNNKPSSASEFVGQVVEIVNAGTVVVRVPNGNDYSDVSVTLSSIRPPRAANKRRGDNEKEVDVSKLTEREKKAFEEKRQKAEEDKVQDAYAHKAKEALRRALIGKKVRCTLDYVQPPYQPPGNSKPFPARPHYSIYIGKQNVAIDLLRKGLARVTSHQGDEVRSPQYAEMILAEKAAQKDAVGLHAPKSRAPNVHNNDLTSQSEARCRPFLTALKRVATLSGVVEIPFSGTRVKLHIPSQSLTIAFALQGVYSEKTEKNESYSPAEGQQSDLKKLYPLKNENGEPIPGNVALHFAREHLFQRDVEVSVEDVDRYGTFFGKLTVNKSDYLFNLVQAGLVKLHYGTVRNWPNADKYLKAEEAAKAEKKGVWWNYDEEQELAKKNEAQQKREAEKETQQKSKRRLVTVTEVISGTAFFYQLADDETKNLVEDMMTDFGSRGWDEKTPYSPQEGDWVAAKFSVDGTWYRAEVLREIYPENAGVVVPPEQISYELRYVDYGNTEVVDFKSIRELHPDFFAQKHPAKAHKAKLAYLSTADLDDEFGEDAAALLKELVWAKTVLASEQFVEGNGGDAVHHVILGLAEGEGEKDSTINGSLVERGLARVETRRQTRVANNDIYNALHILEEKAKSKRLCIWQYGEIPDSDEERQWQNMLR